MTEAPATPTVQKGWALRFFPIWTGDALSVIATILVQFSLVWWFAKTTGSATALAFSSVVGLIPAIIVGPFAGVLVDRWSRRVVMMVANSCIALSTFALVLLFAANRIELWHVYLVLFVRSLCNTFNISSLQATTALMVPKEHLGRVAGINQTMSAAANIGGPPLGALLVHFLPMTGVLMIDVAAALLAIVPLIFIAVPRPAKVSTGNTAGGTSATYGLVNVWSEFKEGFRYVIAWRGLSFFCLFAASINFLTAPLSALLPLLVTQYLGGDITQLGTLTSVYGIGALVGALTLSVWGGFKRRIVTTISGVTGMGVAVLLLAFSPVVGFPVALAAIFLIGTLAPITNGPIDALLQSTVAPEKQGRVFNLVSSLGGVAMPLGLIVAGPLADVIGLQTIIYGVGALLIMMAIAAFNSPVLLNIELQPYKEPKREVAAETM